MKHPLPTPHGAAAFASMALALLSACDRSFARAGEDGGVVLNVPYPMADAERIEGVGRQALSEAGFVFVSLGGVPDDRDHGLPERLAAEGPMLIAHHVEPVGAALPQWQQLSRLAFGRGQPTPAVAVAVDPAELEALGLAAPTHPLWLVGPRGTCRADIGPPVVGLDPSAGDTLIVGYRIDNCPGRSWAQIGIVAAAIPVDFRWVPAETVLDETIPRSHTWDHPLAELVERPPWPYEAPPRFDIARLREIPGTEPPMIQLLLATLSTLPGEDDRHWCELEVSWTRTDGLYNGRWIDPVPWHRDAVGPFMLGAFVNGSQIDAVIYDDRLDGLVVVPPGPLDDMKDPHAWTQVFVPTGVYDPGELRAWGVQPARDGLPVGERCD